MGFKIAFVSPVFPDLPGEDALFAARLAETLGDLTHSVNVVTTAGAGVRNTWNRVESVHKVMTKWGLTELPRLMQTLIHIRPQILHVHYTATKGGYAMLMGLVAESLRTTLRTPVVITVSEQRKKPGFFGKWKEQMLLSSHEIVPILPESEQSLEELANRLNRIYAKLL